MQVTASNTRGMEYEKRLMSNDKYLFSLWGPRKDFENLQNRGQLCNLLSQSFQSRSVQTKRFSPRLFINWLVWTLCLHFASAGRKKKWLAWKNTVSVWSHSIMNSAKISGVGHQIVEACPNVVFLENKKKKNCLLTFCVRRLQTSFLHSVTGCNEAECLFLHRLTYNDDHYKYINDCQRMSYSTFKVPINSDCQRLFFIYICIFYPLLSA